MAQDDRNFGGAQKGLPIARDPGCARDCAVPPPASAHCSSETGCRLAIATRARSDFVRSLQASRIRAVSERARQKVTEARDRLSEVLADEAAELSADERTKLEEARDRCNEVLGELAPEETETAGALNAPQIYANRNRAPNHGPKGDRR
jgi:vacuolar-type H+-ATPase subunit H